MNYEGHKVLHRLSAIVNCFDILNRNLKHPLSQNKLHRSVKRYTADVTVKS